MPSYCSNLPACCFGVNGSAAQVGRGRTLCQFHNLPELFGRISDKEYNHVLQQMHKFIPDIQELALQQIRLAELQHHGLTEEDDAIASQ
eukprot:1339353-Karenia_brevis.AAC.1